MPTNRPQTLRYLVSFVVLLALIAAFFLGSRYPHIASTSVSSRSDDEESTANPQAEAWISKDRMFVWNSEPAAALNELPARIGRFKGKRLPQRVSVSSEPLTRFDDIVYAIDVLKKGGFQSIVLVGPPKAEPDPDRY
jgi:biopolymer transport protein ExbD